MTKDESFLSKVSFELRSCWQLRSTLIVYHFIIDDTVNIPLYTEHDLHKMKVSRLMSRSVSSTDPLINAFNMIKDPFVITINKPVQNGHLKRLCKQSFATIDTLLAIHFR